MAPLSDAELRRLARFRQALRGYLAWSEEHAEAVGLTAARHQLLVAVATADDPLGPTIGELADLLLLRHHSAVGLIDRTAAAGFVERGPDPRNHRVVRIRLTPAGRARLDALAPAHAEEIARLGEHLDALARVLPQAERADGPPRPHPHRPPPPPPPR